MELEIIDFKSLKIAKLGSGTQQITSIDEALNLIGNAGYMDAYHIILHQENLATEFFDLKTRFAGEVLQKFSNYNMRLAIVGDMNEFTGNALNDFVFESNKTGRVLFVIDEEEAKLRWTLNK
jgi:hypothetical protein